MGRGWLIETAEESQGYYVTCFPEQKKINSTNALQVILQVESGM